MTAPSAACKCAPQCRDRQASMGRIAVSAEGTVDAPADTVYGHIADMREHHPHFLPPAFSDFRVESGGVGAGTITRFKVTRAAAPASIR
jgi:hypothetical protein